MIPQLKINRVRIEIGLFGKVGLLILPDIVIDKGHRYDEGDMASLVLLEDLQEFLFFIGGEVILKISH